PSGPEGTGTGRCRPVRVWRTPAERAGSGQEGWHARRDRSVGPQGHRSGYEGRDGVHQGTGGRQAVNTSIEPWRRVWREAVAPLVSTEGLEALRHALASDDARLLQGATISPPPMLCVQEFPVEAACPLGFC